jgi:nitroreductase
VHNTQPWHWCIDGDRLVLFADTARHLRHTDPDGRDLVLSCGAALHHLQVAAAATGWSTHVHRMPNPYNDSQLATISFAAEPASPEALAALDALRSRRTDRRLPSPSPVPREELDRLLAVGPHAGVTVLAVVSHRARVELLQILAEADQIERHDPLYVDEIIGWVGSDDKQGIPFTSLPRRRAEPARPDRPSPVATSRFPSGTLDEGPATEPVQPAMLAICTSSDDTASRLRAGEALSAVLLDGAARGLSMIPLSQATEVEQTRRLLQDELLRDVACPQIVVQVGWAPAERAPVPLTPRRPVDEVLGDIADLPPGMGPYQP